MPARMPAGIEDPEPQLGSRRGRDHRAGPGVGARAAVWVPDTGRKRGRARAAGIPREAGHGRPARRGDSLFSAAPAAQGYGVRTGGARLPVLPPRRGSAVCTVTVEIIVIMVMRR